MTPAIGATQQHQATDRAAGRPHLLIVDDDLVQARLIARGAEQAGHDVTIAKSVAEAIREIATARFDCVTLDLMLEDGDGTEVLAAMAQAKFKGSVILVSGMDAQQRSAARAHARLQGIELRSLPKPLDLSALRVCLADLTSQARDLPPAHMWGGINVSHEYERHRKALRK